MHQGHEDEKWGAAKVRAPHAPGAIIGFAAKYLGAQRAFRCIVVHRNLRPLDKHRQALPMVLQTHQYLACCAAQARIGKLRVTIDRHLLKMRSEPPIPFDKAHRVLPHRQARRVQMIQRADALHPAHRPGFCIRIAARQGEIVSAHVRPTKGEQQAHDPRHFLYAAYRSHTSTVCTKSLEKYLSGTFAPRPGAITNTIAEAERITHRYQRYPTLSAIGSNTRPPGLIGVTQPLAHLLCLQRLEHRSEEGRQVFEAADDRALRESESDTRPRPQQAVRRLCIQVFAQQNLHPHRDPQNPFGNQARRHGRRHDPRQVLALATRPITLAPNHAPVRLDLDLDDFAVFGPGENRSSLAARRATPFGLPYIMLFLARRQMREIHAPMAHAPALLAARALRLRLALLLALRAALLRLAAK